MLQHLVGAIPVAIPGSPLIHLTLCPAGEPQQLRPMPLHKVQHPGHSVVLRVLRISEGSARDVDMQSAGARLMGQIAQIDGLGQHLRPGHLVKLVLQRQRLRDDLEAIIQTAVMFAVGKGIFLIGNAQQSRSVAVILSCTVDLQLNAEIARAGSIEDGTGLEIVIMDRGVFDSVKTIAAIGIVVVQRVPAVIVGDSLSTADAMGIVVPEAVIADGSGLIVAAAVPTPDAAAAVDADRGQILQTVRAQQTVMEFAQVVGGTP